MRHRQPAWLIVLILFVFAVSPALSTDVNFPYANIKLRVAPSEDPFPGFGTHYSSLAFGLKSAAWNPASLGRLTLSESSLDVISPTSTYNFQTGFAFNEIKASFEAGSGVSAGEYGMFLRTPTAVGSGLATQEINLLTNVNYATAIGGADFSSALKIYDWLVFGFSANSPVGMSLDLAGDLPLTGRLKTNLYGQSMGSGMEITSAGKIQFTTTVGGSPTTYESTNPLWSGFLSQEVTVPATNISDIRDNVNFQSPFSGTLAARLGGFYAGLNLIPISATASIDNDIRTVVNSDAQDQFFYVPDFNSDNQAEIANWIQDSDKYGASGGYKRKQIRLPAGETIAQVKYRGFYAASAARMDLGAQYDLSDWFSVGLAMENLGGAGLNFTGSGLAAYINYREINTSEAPSLNDLLQPGGKSSLDLVTDKWVATTEASGTRLAMETEKNYPLPKRLRVGFSLKRPFLIAVDLEQNQTPIKYQTTQNNAPQEVTISNLNFLRVGLESRVFALPAWLRTGLTMMTKPSIDGLDSASQSSLNSLFKFGVLPVRFDTGLEIKAWDNVLGSSLGVNALPLIGTLQIDTANMDLSKMVFYNLYVSRGAWNLSYLFQVDALSTAIAYSNKSVAAGQTKSFELSDLKYVQTLGVTYRF